jgi:hypothetical protein
MALYIPHSIFHLARLLYVRWETFGPYYVPIQFIFKMYSRVNMQILFIINEKLLLNDLAF